MRLLTLSLVATLTALAAARTQQPPTAAPQPTFRSGTRLVQVSVVVHDGRRRPVEGLVREDFQVFEDSREQPISLFEVYARAAASNDPLPAGPPAPAGGFTNRIPSPASGGVVAIIFDQLNMSPQAQTRAREQVLRYLRRLRPTDRVALYALTSDGIRVVYDFTNDAGTLVAALNRVRQGESVELAASQEQVSTALTDGLSAFALGNIQNTKAHFNRLRTETTIDALESVAMHLEGVPGRKNVIWISSGFPIRLGLTGPAGSAPSLLTEDSRRAARALNHSDAVMYPIDARGLLPTVVKKEVSQLGMLHVPIEGLNTMANWTGGRLFYNTNDLAGAMAQAVEDSRVTYTLGYYPSNDVWDGKFRSIKVKVRDRDVEVRHRSGYFALDRAAPDAATRQSTMTAALNSPLTATALRLSVRPTIKQDGRVELAIELPPGTPLLTQDGSGVWRGSVDVLVAQTLASGERSRDMDATQPVILTEHGRAQLLQKGLRLIRTIEVRPTVVDARVVVRDPASGATGSVVIPAVALTPKR